MASISAGASKSSATSKRLAVDAVAPLGCGPLDADAASKRRRISAETAVPVARPVVDAPASTIAPSVPPSAPALQQLVRALGMHERDLRDHVSTLVCMRRHLANCAADLPANPIIS